MVSINCITKAPNLPEKNNGEGENFNTVVSGGRSQTEESLGRRPDTRNSEAYVVERIVRYAQVGDQAHYVVRWFVYSEGDDTVEPPKHISRDV